MTLSDQIATRIRQQLEALKPQEMTLVNGLTVTRDTNRKQRLYIIGWRKMDLDQATDYISKRKKGE